MSAEKAARSLGYTRLVVCCVFLISVTLTSFHAIGHLPTTIMHPPGVMEYLGWKFFDRIVTPLGMEFLKWSLVVAIASAAVGFCGRVTTGISLGLVLLYQGILRSFGHVNHDEFVGIYCLLVLACTPSNHAISVDRYLGSIRDPFRAAIVYMYPLYLMRAILAWSYFTAGATKVRLSGLRYFNSENIPVVAVQHSLDNLHDTQFQYAFWLPELGVVTSLLAITVVAWELTFPLGVLWKRTRWWYLAVGVVFHISTMLFMNITFWNQLAMYLVFVNWQQVETTFQSVARLIRIQPGTQTEN